MGLQKHTSPSTSGDKLPTGDHLDKPFIVNPTEFVEAFDTPKHTAKEGEQYLRANAYDLTEGKAYVNVLFFNPALVDQLGQYVNENGDDATVVRFVDRKTKDGNNTYRTVDAGSDEDWDAAADVDYDAAFVARKAELATAVPAAEAKPAAAKKTQSAAQKAKVEAAFTR